MTYRLAEEGGEEGDREETHQTISPMYNSFCVQKKLMISIQSDNGLKDCALREALFIVVLGMRVLVDRDVWLNSRGVMGEVKSR